MIDHQLVIAARDRRLRRDEYRVLLELHARLDSRQHRTAKLWVVAQALGLHRSHVSRAMGALVAAGYLEVGPNNGALKTYRLVLPEVATGGTSQAA